jgi:indole-3-glycerol phosphate synthase
MLERILADKSLEVQRLQAERRAGGPPPQFDGLRPSFTRNLRRLGPGAVIAEYKPASPSRGPLNPGMTAVQAADAYARGGAAAISVLTEERHFGSSLENLRIMQRPGLPLLRKDFLTDPLQIEQTAATPASAVLLIARLFTRSPDRLAHLIEQAHGFGLEPVVEIFEISELELARQAGASIIQVNNRDLDTLTIDLRRSREMIAAKQPQELWIAASGLETREQVCEMARLGFTGCLIGTSLMLSPDACARLQHLIQQEDAPC